MLRQFHRVVLRAPPRSVSLLARQPRAASLLARQPRAASAWRLSSSAAVAAPPPSSEEPLHPDAGLDAFTSAFLGELDERSSSAATPTESSELLRRLVRSKHLKFTDMRDAPEKFFLAHRLLTTVGLSGFGIRFTVQFNLFAGSVLGLGGPEQVARLEDIQDKGELGCFLLTEKQAGVLSGLYVETTATWDGDAFVLDTPTPAAHKNWISQGLTAEHGVVIARLLIGDEDHGPHAFLMRLRDDDGEMTQGVSVVDMGAKTVANDLDNAAFAFDGARLPRSALLNKFCEIDADGKYRQTTDEPMRIEVIGQRLMSGRVAIAEAALVFAKQLHLRTRKYAETKLCNGPAGETELINMPQLAACLDEADVKLDAVIAYVARVEAELSQCLSTGAIPSAELVERIAVAKIKAIEVAVETTARLRLEVGSYALAGESGFALSDMLLCCKFAEGDSRILQQKLVRDTLKALQKGGLGGLFSGALAAPTETLKAAQLARRLAGAAKPAEEWTAAWRDVYELADIVCDRHLSAAPSPPAGFEYPGFAEPIVDRMGRFGPPHDQN